MRLRNSVDGAGKTVNEANRRAFPARSRYGSPVMALHHVESGSGKTPLVCVHGWGCEGGQFEEISRLLDGDFRIYRPDLPGHGRTPLGTFEPGFAAYAAAVADFVRRCGLERPILLGHSMGGVLSIMAAQDLAVRAVVNLDGSLPAAPHTLAGQAVIRGWLDEPDFRARLADALREGFFLPAEREARCEEIIRAMCAAPDSVLRFLPEKISEIQPERILPAIEVPVLYIGAARPRYDLGAARALLPQMEDRHIPDGGHFLHVYQPVKIAALVRAFAASL